MSGKRRGHGEGSIYRRASDGRWVGTLDLGIVNGRRRRKSLYGPTRREVVAKLAKAQRARDVGGLVMDERAAVGDFLVSWLDSVRSTLRPATWRRYEQYVRVHAVPALGRVPLVRLGPQHLQALYVERLRAGQSPQTVVHLHRVLHRALGQALRWGLVARNVADLVDPPRVRRHEYVTLSPEQARRFLEAARGHRLDALFVLALTTGLRQGELLGLRWQNVDLAGGRLAVTGALQLTDTGWQVGEPKTPRSRRPVLLTTLAVEALRRHRVAQGRERLALGAAWTELDLVFANTVGRPLTPQNLLQREFYPLLARAGLPRIRFHDLRHSAATLLLGEGVHAKIVSELLGHSQTGVTLDLYSHVSPTMQAQAVRALDGLLGCQAGCQEGSGGDEAAGQPS